MKHFPLLLAVVLAAACGGRTHATALAPAGSRAALRPYADSLIANPMAPSTRPRAISGTAR